MQFILQFCSRLLLLLLANAIIPVLAFEPATLTQIDTDQGLNQSEITGLMQDSQGFLWISSLQGINRYDGYRVSTISSPNDVLINNYIALMHEDSHGLIWIGAAPHNNYVLDRKNNSLQQISLDIPADIKIEYPVFNRIVETPQGNLWIATYREIFFYDRQTQRATYINSIDRLFDNQNYEHSIRDLLLIENQLLVATSNELYALDLESHHFNKVLHTEKLTNSKDQKNVKKLHINHQGNLLVGTVDGLFQINKEHFSSLTQNNNYLGKPVVKELNIWEIIEKKDFYWLATNRGLFELSFSGQLKFIFKFSDTKFNTSDDNITSMLEDREGSLWFGTRTDGVFKWHPNRAIKAHYWSGSDEQKKLSDDYVFSIVQAENGKVWLGTRNGLNQLDPKSGKITTHLVNPDDKAFLSDNAFYDVLYRKEQLWLLNNKGVQIYNIASNQIEPVLFPENMQKLFEKPIQTLHFLDANILAMVTDTGVYIYDITSNSMSLVESTKTAEIDTPKYLKIYNSSAEDSNNFFLSVQGGLVRFNRLSGTITPFHQLTNTEHARLAPDSIYREGNKLWVTYPNLGIYQLDAKTGKELAFFDEKTLGVQTIMSIFPDKIGNLWFTSNNGLLRMNKATQQTRIFDASDGFMTSEFNGWSILQMEDGDVMLGSVKGAFHFSPNSAAPGEQREVANHITNVELLSRELPTSYSVFDGLNLDFYHDDFGLRLEFSALLLNKPKQVKYRYWLEGNSAVKPTIIDKSELFLPSFKPGKTHLKISAIDYETGKESPPVSIVIIAHPAPWLSIWAFVAYAFILITITAIFLLRYRQRLHSKEIEHQKLLHSEQRLKLALHGGDSGLWDWHFERDQVYEPRLNSTNSLDEKLYPFSERISAIHPDDRDRFLHAWNDFLLQGKSVFDTEYRMADHNAIWEWYRDIATVTKRDNEQRATRVTGTYTNITKRKQDSEQMLLFSKAFENTRDIVFVLDQQLCLVAANRAFYKVTKSNEADLLNSYVDFIVDSKTELSLVDVIIKGIRKASHWEGEGLLQRHSSTGLPVLINATSFSINQELENYVFALTDISKQKSAEDKLRTLASYDSLTNLPNRALLLDRLKHAIHHSKRRQLMIAVFFIDLDRFKRINDTLGHDIGDLLLKQVAKILVKAVRADDTVARLGGDEFVVVMEDIGSQDTVNHIAQNIINLMTTPLMLNDNQISISPSIGISVFPNDGKKPDTILKHADIAMYHAKEAGRNCFKYYQKSMNDSAKRRLSLENKLRTGLQNNEFYLVYQPQYQLSSGKLCGMEALARWKTTDGEFISPVEFIPLAEELGLIIQMSENLLSQALVNLSRWHQQGHQITLAFNLSARHLQHYDLNQFLKQQLALYPITPSFLEFELTESVLMEDSERVKELFSRLGQQGIELALDDFGTGYSSLKYLTQLPIKKLKIDRSFISKIGEDKENEAIISTIISLARSLNLKTVAEGIETQEQSDFVKQAGAEIAQGYLYSKPIELEAMNQLLANNKLFAKTTK